MSDVWVYGTCICCCDMFKLACVVTCSSIIIIYKVGKSNCKYAKWYGFCVSLLESRKKAKIAQERRLKPILSPNNALVLKVVRLGLCTIDIYIINNYLSDYCMS